MTIILPETQVEIYSTALEHVGAVSITCQDAQDQPIYEPELNTTPLWHQTALIALFEYSIDLDINGIIQNLYQEFNLKLTDYKVELIAEQDWVRNWMAEFQAMRFGNRTWICPSWQSPPQPDGINILLDPGLAFGTGNHATTALCLEWIDSNAELIKDKIWIDYGCGSGILAIAAAKWGAKQVYCVDIDAQALIATRDNAARNKVLESCVICSAQEFQPFAADGLLANILANPLINLRDTFNCCLKPQAPLILSGILSNQLTAVVESYQTYFKINNLVNRQDWCRVDAHKLR